MKLKDIQYSSIKPIKMNEIILILLDNCGNIFFNFLSRRALRKLLHTKHRSHLGK